VTDPINGKRSLRRRYLLALLPIALGGLCCWSVFQPSDPAGALEAAQEFDAELIRSLEPIEESDVETYAVERKGGVIEVGFLLTTVNAERSSSGTTTFEAGLINLGRYPAKDAYVTLRLIDEDGQPVETVDLTGDEEILDPGRGYVVRGEFTVGAKPARIVEETIAAGPDDFFAFSLNSYNDLKESPGILSQIAGFLPFVEYRAVWTHPELDWHSYQVQFRYDRLIKD
jgi:hypothetical protein